MNLLIQNNEFIYTEIKLQTLFLSYLTPNKERIKFLSVKFEIIVRLCARSATSTICDAISDAHLARSKLSESGELSRNGHCPSMLVLQHTNYELLNRPRAL